MKKLGFWYGLCGAVFLLGIAGSVFFITRTPGGTQVDILQDGTLIQHLDLSRAENRTITIEYNGGYNVIELKDNEIRVIEASCPDKTCIHMGSLRRGALPIVCVPNRLVIRFSEDNNDADAVAQ